MEKITIDGVVYKAEVLRRTTSNSNATVIIIPTYMANKLACDVTRVCVESVQKFTTVPYELWVVDNNSPSKFSKCLIENNSINAILSKTAPISPVVRKYMKTGLRGSIRKFTKRGAVSFQFKDGSYANAIGLELGYRLIQPAPRMVFTMHSDCLVTKAGWLNFLKSKVDDKVKAVACWKDKGRVNALHIGGLLFDSILFDKFNMNFFHNMRRERDTELSEYDVGDYISICLRNNGFKEYVCQNTYNSPELLNKIHSDSPLRSLHSDRCFDDTGDIFYMHMGRVAVKAFGSYNKAGKTYPKQWIEFAKEHVLS